MVVFLFIFNMWHGLPLSYFYKKKLMPEQIMNRVGMNSNNIMNSVKFFSDSATMNNIFNE